MLVKSKIILIGLNIKYECIALVDSGTRMSIVDKDLANKLGLEYTGRKFKIISFSEHEVEAMEAIVKEIILENVSLKYAVVAVTNIPSKVKNILKTHGVDENVIIGLLTLERANLIPDTATGKLKKAPAFIL